MVRYDDVVEGAMKKEQDVLAPVIPEGVTNRGVNMTVINKKRLVNKLSMHRYTMSASQLKLKQINRKRFQKQLIKSSQVEDASSIPMNSIVIGRKILDKAHEVNNLVGENIQEKDSGDLIVPKGLKHTRNQ